MLHVDAFLAGIVILAVVLLDAFQTIILPRRPSGRIRLTRVFFLLTWRPYVAFTRRIPSRRVLEQLYSIFGPGSLLVLMVVWAAFLVLAYGLIFFGAGAHFADIAHPGAALRMRTCFYVSGTTLFTLGLGDLTPASPLTRFIIVMEAGTGLGFVALVIGYVPVLYTSFSRREVSVALLDARAGSPPTAGELLLRHAFVQGDIALITLLAEWERWAAEMLESHISYPILCYYRSQHDNQSWISALTAILDTCALLITTVEGPTTRQAQLTFAMARHTLVDLGHVFYRDPLIQRYIAEDRLPGAITRLPPFEYTRLCRALNTAGFSLCASADTRDRLASIRQLYEPQARALSEYLCLDLPQWLPTPREPTLKPDQWTTVHNLRKPAAQADSLTHHISTQSASAALDDTSAHPL